MGARFIPHPAPARGSAGKYGGRPCWPSVGLDDPEPISRSEVGAHRVLEDVVYPAPRPQEPIGRYGDPSYHVVVVEQRHPDREPLPNAWTDLVDSSRRAWSRPSDGRPKSPRIRSRRVSGAWARRIAPRATRSIRRIEATLTRPHDPTFHDARAMWWGGQDSNPRHEG